MTPPDPTPGWQRLVDDFRLESARLIRPRVGILLGMFGVLMGVVVLTEYRGYPDRRTAILTTFALELLAGGATLALCGRPRLLPHAPRIAAVFACWVSVCMSAYNAAVQGEPTRLVMGQLSWLAGVVVLMPWGWDAQLVVALVATAAFAASGPVAPAAANLPFLFVALANGAATSVLGTYFLDRYRRDAFVQTSRLRHASAAQREEAEISAALLHVTETLSAQLDRPGMLEDVTLLTVEALDCDWSSIFVFDRQRAVFRLHTNFGSSPAVQHVLRHLEFPPNSLPLTEALGRGSLVEIADASAQVLIPLDLMRRTGNASSLFVPIYGRAEEMVGVLVSGYRQRTGPFSSKQRRLALGIAHATAVALETARLIGDLQTANRLRSEFVSTISHELRTPLHVMLGYLEMARDPEFEAEPPETLLGRIDTAARELLELIETTLDLSRIESGRDELRLQPVSLPPFWAQLRERLSRLPRAEAVELRWSPDPPRVSILTDPRKLDLVLRNLVGNALKFTERGHVAVTADVDGDTLVVDVADTGVGIAPADQSIVFEMFRQGDGSDSRRFGGVGLGLHIVRRFAEQLGGTVTVASSPGCGSDFTVRLPLAGPRDLSEPRPAATAA